MSAPIFRTIRAVRDEAIIPDEAPHSDDSELSVLGGLLIDNGAFDKIGDIVAEADFYRDDHRRIYRHIARLIEKGEPADVVTVNESIKASEDKDKTGGIAYLASLAGNTPTAHNVRRWGEIVRDNAVLRKLIGVSTEIAESAMVPAGRNVRDLIEGAQDQLERVGRVTTRRRRRDFGAMMLDELQLAQAAAPWVIKSLFSRGDVVVIYGAPGCGKTFFLIDLLLHIARQMLWRGRRVNVGLVVLVAAEAGTSIAPRIIAWREKHIGEVNQAETPFAVLTAGPNLLDSGEVDRLIDKLRELSERTGLPVAVVAFDTLSRSILGADENDSATMGGAVGAADRIRGELGAAVLFTHHSGKDVAKGARGHSALTGAADLVIRIADHVASIEKARDAVAGEAFAFDLEVVELGLDEDGDAIRTCVLSPLGDAPKAKRKDVRLSGPGTVGLQALREAIQEHGETMPATSAIPGGVRAVTIDRWRTQFRLRYGTGDDGEVRESGTIRKAFLRCRDELFKGKVISVSDPYCWLQP